ncbi:hypothetical protein [Burkholderia phage BCSR129]|nr:hypothetical protein [Burkholderia phage BCSR129]
MANIEVTMGHVRRAMESAGVAVGQHIITGERAKSIFDSGVMHANKYHEDEITKLKQQVDILRSQLVLAQTQASGPQTPKVDPDQIRAAAEYLRQEFGVPFEFQGAHGLMYPNHAQVAGVIQLLEALL